MTRSAPSPRARSIHSAILAAFPSTSPTVGLIWARATLISALSLTHEVWPPGLRVRPLGWAGEGESAEGWYGRACGARHLRRRLFTGGEPCARRLTRPRAAPFAPDGA